MKWTSISAIYFLFFAASAFFLLPFGVRTHEEVGAEKVPGQADSAPHKFDLKRHLFKAALLANASAGIILAHNHPSGDPTPSPDDLALTQRLHESGEILGVPVLDHIIVGDRCTVSLRETGCL